MFVEDVLDENKGFDFDLLDEEEVFGHSEPDGDEEGLDTDGDGDGMEDMENMAESASFYTGLLEASSDFENYFNECAIVCTAHETKALCEQDDSLYQEANDGFIDKIRQGITWLVDKVSKMFGKFKEWCMGLFKSIASFFKRISWKAMEKVKSFGSAVWDAVAYTHPKKSKEIKMAKGYGMSDYESEDQMRARFNKSQASATRADGALSKSGQKTLEEIIGPEGTEELAKYWDDRMKNLKTLLKTKPENEDKVIKEYTKETEDGVKAIMDKWTVTKTMQSMRAPRFLTIVKWYEKLPSNSIFRMIASAFGAIKDFIKGIYNFFMGKDKKDPGILRTAASKSVSGFGWVMKKIGEGLSWMFGFIKRFYNKYIEKDYLSRDDADRMKKRTKTEEKEYQKMKAEENK